MILIETFSSRNFKLAFNIEGSLVARECTDCKEFLCIDRFSKHRSNTLGYSPSCKSCQMSPERRRKFNSRRKELRKLNYETQLEKRREYNLKTKERRKEVSIEYRKRNYDKLLVNARNWKKRHPNHVNEYNSRRSRVLSKCKGTVEDSKKIKQIYKQCKERNQTNSEVKHTVDHIIPLNHPDICGLHVSINLQIISAKENSSKKNKWDGTYENLSWKTP